METIAEKLAEIESQSDGRKLSNVWVCGTPSMNETFEKAFE